MLPARTKIWIALVLCVVTAALYARTAWYPFSFNDDPEYVTQNFHVLSGLSLDSIGWAFSSFYAANWHPLTWLSLMLDAQLFGSNPMGFHLVNLLLHVADTVLLFYLLAFMTGATWRSALVAALFALHPLHVESVVWITERKDVLSTLFWLLTLLFYAAYLRKSAKLFYLLSLVAFTLGLMAKPMLVTLPVILLLVDLWPLQRLGNSSGGPFGYLKALFGKQILLEKLPFFALSAAMSLVTILAQRQTVAAITDLPLSERVSNALWSTLLYIVKMLFPSNLAAYYPFRPVPLWQASLAGILLGGAVFLALAALRRRPYLAFGLFWYLVSLAPVIGLIQVGGQAMADRYTYVPLIGLFVILSWGGAELVDRFPEIRAAAIFSTAGLLAACAVLTCVQVGYWKDDKTIYSHTVAVTQENYFAHNMLGIAYSGEGKGELAVAEYLESLKINPDQSGAHKNLGLVLDKQLGRSAEAIGHFETAARLEPSDPLAHYHMAKALTNMGRIGEAVGEYRKAIQLKPGDPYFQNDLGMTLLQLNRTEEAISHLSEALHILPSFGQAAGNLQYALSLKSAKR